jgi:histidyl-tRNA synthetase
MTERKQFRAIKGTRDILPPDSALWNWFEQTAREVFESYGFRDIRLPIFEEKELFARSIGGETDVVSKEMYAFEDFETANELYGLWAAIFSASDPKNDEELIQFLRLVGSFVAKAEKAIDTEMPKTPENLRALDDVRVLSDRLATLRHQGPRETSIVVGALRDAVGGFEFGESLTLRPEATASVCRAYIEHGMHTLPGNVKLYYIGPMFRRERPQKGRYRQFYQIGAEVLGQSDAPAIDAEVLEMLLVFFHRVGLTRTTLYVNSIGCKECRPKYVEFLREELSKVRSQLGTDSQGRIETNTLRVLDSKLSEEQPLIEKLPRISDHLCPDCREHFAKLKDELKLRRIAYEENWRLVRGLDYYTRTTFEVTAAGLGSQNAVCGGGRYDGLVELLGGPPTKGIGFAIGSDRAILSIQESGNLPHLPGLSVFVAWMGAKAHPAAVNIARKLREVGLAVELPPEEMKFKKSLGLADKLGARYALILGEDEVAAGIYTLKRLRDAEQKKLSEDELLEYLESERRG